MYRNMSEQKKLAPNSLSFIALTNEYCQALENADNVSREDFLANMLKILPRVYIIANDLEHDFSLGNYNIEPYLAEDVYNQVQSSLRRLLAEEDVYLEVFVEDMKYSDTPIAASISENLADLYQVFFNFLVTLKDAPTEAQVELIGECKNDFRDYWGQILCNVLRAIHTAFYAPTNDN